MDSYFVFPNITGTRIFSPFKIGLKISKCRKNGKKTKNSPPHFVSIQFYRQSIKLYVIKQTWVGLNVTVNHLVFLLSFKTEQSHIASPAEFIGAHPGSQLKK